MLSAPEYLTGIIHCHSKYSFDSLISIRSYLRAARRRKLDFIILTDHNTMKGSAELRRVAARSMPRLQVPLAAEYLTECGDVIAVFLKAEIQARALEAFVAEARAQGAMLLLPHPYVSHREIPRLAQTCDLVEAFNSRASERQNRQAAELAAALNKPAYAGSDAHLAAGLRRVILEVEKKGDLRTSLLQGKIRWTAEETPRWETAASRMIKAWKTRDAALAWAGLRKWTSRGGLASPPGMPR